MKEHMQNKPATHPSSDKNPALGDGKKRWRRSRGRS